MSSWRDSPPGSAVHSGEPLPGSRRSRAGRHGPTHAWRDEGRIRAWSAHPGPLDGPPAEVLERLFDFRPSEWMRRLPMRETFAWPGPQGSAVVKRFLADEPGEALSALLHLRAPRSPGRREAENLRRLAEDGFPVPAALGWWEERNPGGVLERRFGRSAVLMERVAHRATLRDLCRSSPAEAQHRWLGPLAELVARLHALGWYHRDLYLQHVVVADGPAEVAARLVLLDVGRARRERHPRRRWFVKDLAALQHSSPASLGWRARLRFLALYCDAVGLGERESRRALARDVLAKARRIAAHAPRHVDPDDALRGGAP